MDEDKQGNLDCIEAYFEEWKRDLEKTKKVLVSNNLLPQWRTLMCCHIDACSAFKYPDCNDNAERFKTLVLKCSGKKEFYNQIDLHFLYGVDKYPLVKRKPFKCLNNRETIKKILEDNFELMGNKNDKTRYQSASVVLEVIEKSGPDGIDMQNIKKHIADYSLASFLYHVIRCLAVHENDHHGFSQYTQHTFDGNVIHGYSSNHILTPEVIWDTLSNILTELNKECLAKCRFPQYLYL